MSEEPNGIEGISARTSFEVEQDIRDAYAISVMKHSLGPEVISEVISDLESSSSWTEFARKQQINTLRIEVGSNSERIMKLVREYYELKEKE